MRHYKFSSPEGVILQMFYVPLAGVSPCFSSAAICLFLHLLTLLFLSRGRANRHLCIWERTERVNTTSLVCPLLNANTAWLGVHIMDHATEQAWHYCRVPTVLIHSSSQIWLAAKGSDNNIFSGGFSHKHGVQILVSSFKMACMIVSHPGRDFFSCKRLADVMLVWCSEKMNLMYLLCFQFQIKSCILYGKRKRGRERGCRVSVTLHDHYQWVISKLLMNACLTCFNKKLQFLCSFCWFGN